VAPVQTFPTADGWIFIMCMTDKFWGELLAAIGRTDLASDPRFVTQPLRQANREALMGIIDGELKRESTAFWLDRLNGVLPIAPVLDLAQALDSPFLKTTDMIHTISHPAKPGMRVLANPIKIDGERLAQTPCSPYGADTASYVGEMRAAERAGSR
jgi:crotonobetainyl-CoA:carnitine CoA-transferase CaiB-like acyl-CoA transferase